MTPTVSLMDQKPSSIDSSLCSQVSLITGDWWNVHVSFLCTPIHIDCVGGLLLFNRDLMGKEDNIGQWLMWFQFYLLSIRLAKRLLNFWGINKMFSVMCSPLTQRHKLYSFKDPLHSVTQLRKLKEKIWKDKISPKSIHVHKKKKLEIIWVLFT